MHPVGRHQFKFVSRLEDRDIAPFADGVYMVAPGHQARAEGPLEAFAPNDGTIIQPVTGGHTSIGDKVQMIAINHSGRNVGPTTRKSPRYVRICHVSATIWSNRKDRTIAA